MELALFFIGLAGLLWLSRFGSSRQWSHPGKFHYHRLRIALDTGFTRYLECRDPDCDARMIRQGRGGHQPIDRGWLETGKWTVMGAPPPPQGRENVIIPSPGGPIR